MRGSIFGQPLRCDGTSKAGGLGPRLALLLALWGAALLAPLVLEGRAAGDAPPADAPPPAATPDVPLATGIVFEDLDGDGARDEGEPGLAGVRVSNRREVVRTDAEGRWALPTSDDAIFFVVKPRGYAPPLARGNLPRFYYVHKPKGSPPSRFPGVDPTGPLPTSIDFPLRRVEEPDRFEALLFGDPQPRDLTEVDYIGRDVIPELSGTRALFGVTLGDIVFNDLRLFRAMADTTGLLGVPWHHVIGNHDINADAASDAVKDETFERVFGPGWYSFDYGPVHFIVLDNIRLNGREERRRGRPLWDARFGDEQLAFVANDLREVPEEQLVVLFMHVPLHATEDRQALYRLIERRPFALSVSAHRHFQRHVFIDRRDGWQGEKPHHHLVNVTVCGSWWSGEKDEEGIPHATMSDGAPNGYSVITFEPGRYEIEYRAARRGKDVQMRIFAPHAIAAGDAGGREVFVNVFAGSSRSVVEMRVGGAGEWVRLEKVRRADPGFERMVKEEGRSLLPGGPRPLPTPSTCDHLWVGALPGGLRPGLTAIQVRTTDMFGHTYEALHPLRVR